ncbi:transmembrane protein 107-like [Portunus trituberculatus]|uniref:transmembrane protein 107-like n=1 Tax=Portunus trituberculatus TaxID=210409 RepID=UPI001E1D0620|nr:transmembrane protein 107-like [Portunus trituberculatus]XP_045125636.1 transmembrane protein 107-like [Portunus trituberculatus]XP_045125637.1 transmembrane protein 107-like [Portunus trituberculatus]
MRVTGLIPARFLTLTSHLVLLVTILMAREENVLACLPVEYSSSEYSLRDGEFLGGLVAGIALTALELIGFITGVSMFASLPSIVSIACHSGASVSLAYLVLDSWDCQLYWWVFALTSVLPALVEVGVMVNVLMLKKNV